mmetsp:Transcript_2914/g.6985  ORF Transcript_2914/g.6985 Transcript_2914/m.6985 type:complete len:791 (-) Transcript_2914:76-2448(-)
MQFRGGGLALGGVLALCLVGLASAGPNANAFSEQTSRPMMKSMGGDLNFGYVIALSSAEDPNAAVAEDCENGGGSCQYVLFIVNNFFAGLLVLPLCLFLFNLVFCCGRCCCRKKGRNVQGCTGGRYPTREYNKMEGLACILLLACFMIILFAFTVAGAAAFDELKGDLDLMLDGIGDLGETPGDFKVQITGQLDTMKVEIREQLTPINDVFTAVGEVKTAVSGMRTAFTDLDTKLRELASLIEGCKSTSPTCTSATRVANWNKCSAGSYTHADAGTGTAVGPAITGSGATVFSPTCRNPTTGALESCQCAPTVHAILAAVETTVAGIPSDGDLSGLDVPLPLDDLDRTIDDAASDFQKPLDDFQDSVPFTRKDTDIVKEQINGGLISLITFVGYSPAWYVIIMITVALILGAQFGPMKGNDKMNGCGDTCWWISYVVLTLWLMLFCWPLFGAFTVPAVFLEDLCEVLPTPGGTAQGLTDILVAADSDPMMIDLSEGLFEGCLLPQPPEKGYIWSAIPEQNITKQFMRDMVSEFSTGNAINATQITSNLRVLEYTSEFSSFIKPQIAALDAASYTTFGIASSYSPSYSAPRAAATDISNFQGGDLLAAVNAVDAASAAVDTAITNANTKSAAFEVQLNSAINSTASITEFLVDSLWELGTCELLASKYAGLYEPFCNIAHIFGASWGALLLSGCFGMLILPCVCCVSKRMYQYRVPLADQQNKLAQEGGTIAPMTAQAAPGGQAQAVFPVATAVPVAVPVAAAVAVPADPGAEAGAPEPVYPDLSKPEPAK